MLSLLKQKVLVTVVSMYRTPGESATRNPYCICLLLVFLWNLQFVSQVFTTVQPFQEVQCYVVNWWLNYGCWLSCWSWVVFSSRVTGACSFPWDTCMWRTCDHELSAFLNAASCVLYSWILIYNRSNIAKKAFIPELPVLWWTVVK